MLKISKRFVVLMVVIMMFTVYTSNVFAAVIDSSVVDLITFDTLTDGTVTNVITKAASSTVLSIKEKETNPADKFLSVAGNTAYANFSNLFSSQMYCIFELDFMQETKTNGIRFNIIGDDSHRISWIYTNGNAITLNYGTATTNLVSSYAVDTWYNFKVLVDFATKDQYLYVNNNYINKINGFYTSTVTNTDINRLQMQAGASYDNVRVQGYTSLLAAQTAINAQNYIAKNSDNAAAIQTRLDSFIALAENDTSTNAEIEAAATKLNAFINLASNPNPRKIVWEDDFTTDKSYPQSDTGVIVSEKYKIESNQRLLYYDNTVTKTDMLTTEFDFEFETYAQTAVLGGIYQHGQTAGTGVSSPALCRVYTLGDGLYFDLGDINNKYMVATKAECETGTHNIKLEADFINGLYRVYFDHVRRLADKVFEVQNNVIIGVDNVTISNAQRPFNSQCGNYGAVYYIDNLNIYKNTGIYELSFEDQKNVTGNITIPTETNTESTVTWISSDPGTVSPTGTVTRQTDVYKKYVTLTASWSRLGYNLTRDYVVEVLGNNNLFIIDRYFTVSENKVSAINNSDIIAFNVEAVNNRTDIADAIVVIAIYDKTTGKLKQVVKSDVGQLNTGEGSLSATLTVPSEGTYFVKGFVWNCYGSMIPYTATMLIEMAK